MDEARERAITELEAAEAENGEPSHTLITDEDLVIDWSDVPEEQGKRADVTPSSRADGRSLHRTTRSGKRCAQRPRAMSGGTRSTAATDDAPSGSRNVASPAAMVSSNADASAAGTMPSRSRPRRFKRTKP